MDKIFTLDEVAASLLMTRRGVAKVAKRRGLCMVNGRILTFTADDVEGIKQAMRPAPIVPMPTPVRGHADGRVGKVQSASPKLRKLLLERSKRPWARQRLKEEFGE
ncbi:hypothetical protein EB230_21050 [Mesorhizobium sp. NZP2234]|uniref:hypothetical protein n=1 Tax=Mesorhizobium sp. NZP2234 TaxID=2483402 RepID=UPI00155304A8|nr:hypothetical protein [Mesorhizobium sp. NZP2234]QKC90612.1 hypothetical protein EB230_21050 [Mesorhizobium sp. NZP2234]